MKHTHTYILILALLFIHGSAAQADMFSFRCLHPALSGFEPSTKDAYLPFTSVAPMSYGCLHPALSGSDRDAQDTYSRHLMQTGSSLSDNRRMAEVFAAMAVSTTAPRSDNMLPPTMGAVGFSKLSAVPMLMADGTVYSPSAAAAPTMPQRSPGTPGGILDEPPLPVGEPLLPLFLLAAAYACHKHHRLKKILNPNS